jgi:hypothetical protein
MRILSAGGFRRMEWMLSRHCGADRQTDARSLTPETAHLGGGS